jgi:dihydroorotase
MAEVVHIARDLLLAELSGAHLHVAHVSTAGGVAHVREARARGIHVTAEVTPHHLTLTDEATLGYDPNTKMADVAACVEALADGTIDAIATDHAPHAVHEKEVEFTAAPPGVLGFETAFPVVLELVRSGKLTPLQLIASLTWNPARVLRLPMGRLEPGAAADLVLLDPEQRWVYDPAKGFSKSRNSPWAGHELQGRLLATWVDGQLVHQQGRGDPIP